MIIYFAILIPIITIIIGMIWKHKKITWWEAGLSIALPLCFIFLMKYWGQQSLLYSDEYWNSYGTYAEYYEDWNEYIHQTCTRTYPCGTDGDGNTEYCTETYDCSYVQHHPEYWELHGNSGEVLRIDKIKYDELCKRWNNKVFMELNRNYHTIDGNKYVTRWSDRFETIEPITTIHRYKNKVKHSDSVFQFRKIDRKKVKIFDYYKPIGYACSFIYGYTDNESQMLLRRWNAFLGANKKAVIIIVIYENLSREESLNQEAFWKGGNKNEFIVCIGKKDNDIQWVNIISWTPQTILKTKIQREVSEMKQFNLENIIEYIGTEINGNRGYVRKDFEEFDYITVPVPLWSVISAYLLSCSLSLGLIGWSIFNEFGG